jgi:hypothetical protein
MEVSLVLQEIERAFRQELLQTKREDELRDYLRELCVHHYPSPHDAALANNRCIAINAELTGRYCRSTLKATFALALVVALLSIGELCMALLTLLR